MVVKPWIREGVSTWQVGDAGDSDILNLLWASGDRGGQQFPLPHGQLGGGEMPA